MKIIVDMHLGTEFVTSVKVNSVLAKLTLHNIEPSIIGTLLSVQTLQTGQSICLVKVIQWTHYR